MTMAFTPKALSADYKYSFRPVIPSDVFSDPQIKWVVQKLGAKRIGGLFPNDESGQQVGARQRGGLCRRSAPNSSPRSSSSASASTSCRC